MTVVRKHSCTEDRKDSTGCSEYDVLAVSDVASGDRNEERQMSGRVS